MSILLLVPTIRGYYIEAEKSVYKLFLAISKILIDYIIECVIYYRVISNNGSKLLKNSILL